MDKYKIQENQYSFPYHHIPYLDKSGNFFLTRSLSWSFRYFCYLLHAKEILESLGPKSILDVGCGDGRLLGLLSENITRKVGIDLSAHAISFAKAFNPNIEFLVGDISEIKEQFDVVCAIEVLEHIPDEEMSVFFQAIENKIKIKGYAVFSVPTKVIPLQKKHYRHYDLKIFKRHLKDSKTNLSIVGVNYVYRYSLLIRIYSIIMHNRFWTIDFNLMNKILWKYVWDKLKMTNEKLGTNMVVILKKD